MAKYDITYICGHTGTVQLFGAEKDRQSKIEWLQSINCPDCFKSAQADDLTAFEQVNNLPELIGSEKQIAWARTIRRLLIIQITELYEKTVAMFPAAKEKLQPEQIAQVEQMLSETENLLANFINVAEARRWIDVRDETIVRIPKAIALMKKI